MFILLLFSLITEVGRAGVFKLGIAIIIKISNGAGMAVAPKPGSNLTTSMAIWLRGREPLMPISQVVCLPNLVWEFIQSFPLFPS
jgi:hypothetical protein